MPISLWSTLESQPAIPGSVLQRRSRPRSSATGAETISGILSISETLTAFASIERCQKGADVLEIRPGEIKGGHPGSGLDRLRIGDPTQHVSGCVRQSTGCNCAAAHQMGEVWRDGAASSGAADRVASPAMKDKEPFASSSLRQGREGSRPQLTLEPGV